jgi:hypothetical protein
VTFDVPRASLFAAVLVVLGGYAFVFRPLETAVAGRYAELETQRTTLERSLALTRRIPQLAKERADLEGQLGGLHLRDRRVVLVERFLRAVAAAAARDRLAVQSVVADARGATALPARPPQAPLFDELALELTLRGGYADVIRAVRELNGGNVAARMSLTSLTDADRRPGLRPQLNAAFHVRLLREADESTFHDALPR